MRSGALKGAGRRALRERRAARDGRRGASFGREGPASAFHPAAPARPAVGNEGGRKAV